MVKLRILTDEESLLSLSRLAADSDITFDHKLDSSGSDSDPDSLFDEPMDVSSDSVLDDLDKLASGYIEPPSPTDITPAARLAPAIPGLYFDPTLLLPDELAESLFQRCIDTYFRDNTVNQIMLFERVTPAGTPADPSGIAPSTSSLPPFLTDLLHTLSAHLRPLLPPETHTLLFPDAASPPRARQVILNFYRPGEGITPHVDLLDRFGDGIIGVSLGSGCVMRFARADPADADPTAPTHAAASAHDDDAPKTQADARAVFLPHGSVYVMSGEARYRWTHGIDGATEDWVQECVGAVGGRWVMRAIRVSITFRWLLPGADVVGGLAEPKVQY